MKGPQPKGAAPVSREVVDVVKRKMAPAGPPPAGMSFHAPKKYTGPPRVPSQYDQFDNHIEDDYDHHKGYHEDDDDYYRRGRDDDTEDYDSIYSERLEDRSDSFDEDDRYDESRYERARPDYNGIAERDEDERMHARSGSNRDRDNFSPRRHEYDDDDRHGRRDYADDLDRRDGYSPRRRGSRGGYDDNQDSRGRNRGEGGYDSRSEPKQYRSRGNSVDEGRKSESAQSKNVLAIPESRPKQQHPQQAVANAKLAAKRSELLMKARKDMVNALLQQAKNSVFSYQPVLRATYRELRHFVTFPCPPGVTARCYIERNRSGTKMLAPFYSVCADLEDGTGRELMVCRKVMRSRSPHYIFSLKAEDLWRKREQRSRLYLGKLRATSSSEYVLFDNGICDAPEEPESLLDERQVEDEHSSRTSTPRGDKKGEGKEGEDASLYRKELAVVHFNTKSRPPPPNKRGTEVCIPATFSLDVTGSMNLLGKPNAAAAPGGPVSSHAYGAHHLYNVAKPFEKVRAAHEQNEKYSKSCFVIHERTSRYDPLSACLVDFKNRANMASVKNCQFVVSDPESETKGESAEAALKRDAEKEWVLQLGKTTDDCFNMDFRYPLSLMQAFAICIARFDAKLTW